MSIFNAIKKWNDRKENSDLKNINVTSSGAFYMKSKDLFDNKKESLELLKKLNESINKHSSNGLNNKALSE